MSDQASNKNPLFFHSEGIERQNSGRISKAHRFCLFPCQILQKACLPRGYCEDRAEQRKCAEKDQKKLPKKKKDYRERYNLLFFSLEDYFQPVSLDYRDTVKLYRSIFSRDGHNSERLNLVNTSSNAAYILFLCFILSLLLFSIISYPIRSPQCVLIVCPTGGKEKRTLNRDSTFFSHFQIRGHLGKH